MKKHQTLSEFMMRPFHGGTPVEMELQYNKAYNELMQKHKIKLHSITEIEHSYYYHVLVPSESKKNSNYYYDVVIRFFPDSRDLINNFNIRHYKMQFFSNSPSFMYKYAYVYNKNGYLIERLYNKLDVDYINTPPTKTNIKENLSYDKSIYFACRFLNDSKFRYLDINGAVSLKKVSPQKFFSNISDFKSVKMDQILIDEEKKLAKAIKTSNETNNNTKERVKTTNKENTKSSFSVVRKKTGQTKITGNKKITGKKKT